jgi:uncharacterized protein (DUF362 family)
MDDRAVSRRQFLRDGACAAGALLAGTGFLAGCGRSVTPAAKRYAVSIVRIRNGNVRDAVEESMRLLGGVGRLMGSANRILLKPNLAGENPSGTTKVNVSEALACVLLEAGKEVSIGDGAAAVQGHNARYPLVCRTQKAPVLDRMQAFVFEALGYTDMAKKRRIPLVNLHTGDMATVAVPNAYVYDALTVHRSLTETDMVCSVPMMKTHTLAWVSLALKNMLGCYPASVYSTVRGGVHDAAAAKGSPAVAYETVDMVKAIDKMGFTLVDASTAMEGNGPFGGPLVPMGLIVAGANALAVDTISAALMGFKPETIPTLTCAGQCGLGPSTLEDIEVLGTPVDRVARRFRRPRIDRWLDINRRWGVEEVRSRPCPREGVRTRQAAIA